MGNSQSCCSYASPKQNRKRKEDVYQPARTAEETAEAIRHPSHSNLQHISEREPEDIDGDPSNNPTTSTLFLVRSKTDLSNNKIRRSSHYDNHHHNYDYGSLKKFSSCSTIFIDDSTVSQPNLKNTIKAVALAIYFHIKNRDRNGPTDGRYLDIFDEKLHPLSKEIVPSDYDKRDPEHKAIYRFVRTLFTAAQLTAECAIVTLVYLERLLMYAEIDICPSNWRRIVLGAILLASKVWDDQAVWNVDYCQILKDIQVEDILEIVSDEHGERLHQDIKVMQSSYQGKFNPNMMGDYCWFLQREAGTSHKLKNMSETFLNIWNVPTMNELERQFLELLQFNINVPSSVYAKYYFDLRALADAHDLSFPLEPLSKERALKLEAMSSVCEDKMKMWMKKDLKRSTSLDGLTASQRTSKAILS